LGTKANDRSEGRSNVFLTATLDTGAGSVPVRIRNLSSTGALIDGGGLPPPGAKVRLMRGRLSAAGELSWQARKQAGLSFEGEINVDEWVQRLGHAGQQRVDGVIAALRNSEPVPREQQGATNKDSLPVISAALDQICERLAGTPNMSVELGEELLRLDVLAQSLRRVATGRKF
jgi:hypothetical protein